MGDRSLAVKKDEALTKLDEFRGSQKLKTQAETLQSKANKTDRDRLQIWIDFFDQYQLSTEARAIKIKIDSLESKIQKKLSTRKEGYIDPQTKRFVKASTLKMRTLISTSPDEKLRKACFDAREKLAHDCLEEYVELVKLRNEFAHAEGYEDFYDYNLRSVDKMTKDELFSLFDDIADKVRPTFKQVRALEQEIPKLRKPWNFGYLMSGDFTQEEDPYFQFDQALDRWGRSFSALGIDFKHGTLQLDLLDREGKYSNGFCHWPKLVNFHTGARQPGQANFTCNVVAGQVGSGSVGYMTLFHEGGHAAHFLNVEQKDVCLNHEFAPMTAAWAETQSMFIDTMFSSIEWKTRYARNEAGDAYPLELYERMQKKLGLLKPWRILSIAMVATFEKEVYELKNPTPKKILAVARRNYKRFTDLDADSLMLLNVPHIYSWDSSCSYHGYGLAEIALNQWREYFYKKYGYIVDNKQVGKEMRAVWKLGASKSFAECVKLATGKELSSKALIADITRSPEASIRLAKKKLKRMESVREYKQPVNLKADITMVHGKKTIATNKNGFAAMADKYGKWVRKMSEANK
jgi:oligoendopeptidase F